MSRRRLYLDTSVPSAFFDDRALDRQQLTRQFWKETLPTYDGVISSLVVDEIDQTRDEHRRTAMLRLVEPLGILDYDPEAVEHLVAEYVRRGVFSAKTAGDAVHVAIAVTNEIGYLASWNFKHLVRIATRREVNLVNSLSGYSPIEIVAPPEL